MAFKGERINPIKGLGRVFSAKGLMELIKALAKFLVVGVIGAYVLFVLFDDLLQLGRLQITFALANTGELISLSS